MYNKKRILTSQKGMEMDKPNFYCDNDHCKSHEYVMRTMERLESISLDLARNQSELVTVVGRLAALTERVEKLEENQEEIKKFIYKIGGAIGFVALTSPLIAAVIQKLV